LIYFDCQLTDTILYHYSYSCNIVCQRANTHISLLIDAWHVLHPLGLLDLYRIH